jgi:hypothetical protein
MDPYLEGSEWTSVHTSLAVKIAEQLAPHLLLRYMARTEKRYITTSLASGNDVDIYPDAAVAKVARPRTASPTSPVTIAAAPTTIPTVVPTRVPQVSVVIRDIAGRQLVTAIEILSPTNKQRDGRAEYLERRERLLISGAHLVEIDLLRRGQRVSMRRHLPSVPYFVFVGRANRRPLTEVWPITLRQPLPTVPIPLLPGDADVPLDLQQALTGAYDGCAYGDSIHYSRRAEVPPSKEDAAWAKRRIAERRKRGA